MLSQNRIVSDFQNISSFCVQTFTAKQSVFDDLRKTEHKQPWPLRSSGSKPNGTNSRRCQWRLVISRCSLVNVSASFISRSNMLTDVDSLPEWSKLRRRQSVKSCRAAERVRSLRSTSRRIKSMPRKVSRQELGPERESRKHFLNCFQTTSLWI